MTSFNLKSFKQTIKHLIKNDIEEIKRYQARINNTIERGDFQYLWSDANDFQNATERMTALQFIERILEYKFNGVDVLEGEDIHVPLSTIIHTRNMEKEHMHELRELLLRSVHSNTRY